jgi:hypothetical protein
VKLPAAGVQPVQRWLRELVAEFGWLPGDQGAFAAAGAAAVDDRPVRLACHAVPGQGEVAAVEVQPDDGEVLSLLQRLAPGGRFAPAGRAGQGGPRGGGAGPRASGWLAGAVVGRVRQRGQRPGGCGRPRALAGLAAATGWFEVPVDGFAGHAEGFGDLGDAARNRRPCWSSVSVRRVCSGFMGPPGCLAC